MLVPFEVPVVSDNWICWSLFLDKVGSFFLKPSQTTRGDVGAVRNFKGFLTLRLNYFLQFSSCGPWRVFSHSNSPSHCVLRRYRHTSSSRQFRNILCWLEILNYCSDGGNWVFTSLALFLKPLHKFVKLNYLLLHIRNIFIVFFLIVMDD